MAFEIRIKPLVLFDLEDRIKGEENKSSGAGRRFYEDFLASLSELQQLASASAPVYESVQKYATQKLTCNLFYMISEGTIYIMGLS